MEYIKFSAERNNIMDQMEITFNLRLINELIKSYSKISISSPTEEGTLMPPCAALLTSNWLLNIRDELNNGQDMKLSALVAKIRSSLEDCFRGVEPLLTVFVQALLTEQALEREILKLPRKLRNKWFKGEYNTYGNGKRAGKNLVLHSKILTKIIRRKDKSKTVDPRENEASAGNKESNINSVKILKRKAVKSCKVKESEAKKKEKCTQTNETISSPVSNVKSLRTRVVLLKDNEITKQTQTETLQKTALREFVKIPVQKKQEPSNSAVTNDDQQRKPSNENDVTIAVNAEEIDKVYEKVQSLPLEGNFKTCPHYSCDISNSNAYLEIEISQQRIYDQILDSGHLSISGLESQLGLASDTLMETLSRSNTENYDVLQLEKEISLNKLEENGLIDTKETHLIHSTPIIKRVLHQGNDSAKHNAFDRSTSIANTTMGQTLNQHQMKTALQKKRSSSFLSNEDNRPDGNEDEMDKNSKSSKKKKHNELADNVIYFGVDNQKILKKTKKFIIGNKESVAKCKKQTKDDLTTEKSDIMIINEIYDLTGSQHDVDESIPEVIKVMKHPKHTLRMNNLFNENSEVTVEKIIINQTLDDDDDDEKPKESDVQNDTSTKKGAEDDLILLDGNDKISYQEKEQSPDVKNNPQLKENCRDFGKKGNEINSNIQMTEEDACTSSNITEYERNQIAELWKLTTLATEENVEELMYMSEIPEISCFLHVCQKTLRIPFFTHFELERAIIIPHASCLMAAIVTALISGAPGKKEAKTRSPLPYLEWNRKLAARISHWFLIQKRLKSYLKVYGLIGVEPMFWEVIGSQRNPLCLKPFNQLTIHHRVTILKALCDHLFHVSKRIQTALLSTPTNGREGDWLGKDARRKQYIFFPVFLRPGAGDLRIYQMEEEYIVYKEENKTQEEISPVRKLCHGKADIPHENVPDKRNCMDQKFYLVADDIHTLNELVRNICSAFSEEELTEAEEKLSMKKTKGNIEKMRNEQEWFQTEEEEITSGEQDESTIELSPRDTHLLLAIRIRSLAKNLQPLEKYLNKSRAAAQAKLRAEWANYIKDGFCVSEKNYGKQKTRIKSIQNSEEKKASKISERTQNNKVGQQLVSCRMSLSRKAKFNAGNRILKEGNQLSRKAIVAEMEEDALIGRSKVSEEELKWDTCLWADEESDEDSIEDEEASDEDFTWHGCAVQNDKNLKAINTAYKKWSSPLLKEKFKKMEKFTGQSKQSLELVKTYARVPLIKAKNSNVKILVPLKHEITNQESDGIHPVGEKFNCLKPACHEVSLGKDTYLNNREKRDTSFTQNILQVNQEEFFGKLSLTPVQSLEKTHDSSVNPSIITRDRGKDPKQHQFSEHISTSPPKVKQMPNDATIAFSQPKNDSFIEHRQPIVRNIKIVNVPRSQETKTLKKRGESLQTENLGQMLLEAEDEKDNYRIVIENQDKETLANDVEKPATFMKNGNATLLANDTAKQPMRFTLNQSTIRRGPSISLELEQTGYKEKNVSIPPSLEQSTNAIGTKQTTQEETVKQSISGFKPYPLKSITLRNVKMKKFPY